MSRRSGNIPKPVSAPAPTEAFSWSAGWVFAAIILLMFLAYLPALHAGFIWDDDGHITRADLRSLAGLFRIWFEPGATQQYYPILHSAFWLEHLLWGDAPLGYHLLNILFHATAAFLFGRLLLRLAISGAWLAALLFALHPVCVESVAWISEQKNTLSAVFYLAAALSYLRFDQDRRGSHYARAIGFFVLALLTKTVTASLPAALLVVFWWQRGKLDWRRDVLPLLPWFILGAGTGLYTAHFERTMIGAQGADFTLGFLERGLLAGRIIWFYLGNLAWPADLIFTYPRWTVDLSSWWQWLFPVGALGLLASLVRWQRRSRAPLAALLLFAGTLFPVLGFFNVYPFVFSFVADHFQYLANLAVFALVAAGLVRVTARFSRWGGYAVQSLLLLVLAFLTWTQTGIYRDSETLYRATLARNPDSWMAHHNLATLLAKSGRVEEAIPHLQAVLKVRPDYPAALNNLGDDLTRLGRAREAIPHLERAVALKPAYALAERNLGVALAMTNRTAEAIPHFQRAVQLQPNFADAEMSWAVALMLTNRFPEAVPHFEKAITLEPESAELRRTYGRALVQAGKYTEALTQYETVVRLDPEDAESHMNLALGLRQMGRLKEAAEHYQLAIQLNPELARTQ